MGDILGDGADLVKNAMKAILDAVKIINKDGLGKWLEISKADKYREYKKNSDEQESRSKAQENNSGEQENLFVTLSVTSSVDSNDISKEVTRMNRALSDLKYIDGSQKGEIIKDDKPGKDGTVGRTNKERMEQGLAPIGIDGRPMVLHHITQTDDGPIIEMLATVHTANYATLHWNTGQEKSLIERNNFNKWRENYWKKRE